MLGKNVLRDYAQTGWGPFNYNCLLNPEIQLTKFGVVPLN